MANSLLQVDKEMGLIRYHGLSVYLKQRFLLKEEKMQLRSVETERDPEKIKRLPCNLGKENRSCIPVIKNSFLLSSNFSSCCDSVGRTKK